MKTDQVISLTSGVVLVYVISTTLPVQLSLILLLFLLSSGLLFYMVIRILKDPVSTDRTFDDYFYQDADIRPRK